jgi:hypothetical protein
MRRMGRRRRGRLLEAPWGLVDGGGSVEEGVEVASQSEASSLAEVETVLGESFSVQSPGPSPGKGDPSILSTISLTPLSLSSSFFSFFIIMRKREKKKDTVGGTELVR